MTKSKWISVIVVVLAAVIALVVTLLMLTRTDETESTPAVEQQEPTPSEQEGDTGRSGSGIELDAAGRQVVIPDNPAGDLLSRDTDGGGTCEDIRSPADVEVQRVHHHQILFSTDSGPTEIVDDIPVGYAEGPRGAVLAAINYAQLMRGGGEITRSVYLDRMVTSEEISEEIRTGDIPEQTKPLTVGSAAFRVTSCSERAVGVDVAFDVVADEDGRLDPPEWSAFSLLVVKDGGEWKLDADHARTIDRVIDKGGWVTWDY